MSPLLDFTLNNKSVHFDLILTCLNHHDGAYCVTLDSVSFCWRQISMTSCVDASSRPSSDCVFRTGGEVVGPTGAGEHDAGAHLAATRRQQPVLCCVCVCVCVCVSLLPSANLRGTRVHIVRRHTDELHASDQKHNEEKKKRDSPPVKGTTT